MIEPYVDGAPYEPTKWWTDPDVQIAIREGRTHVEGGNHSGGMLIRAGADLVMFQDIEGRPLRRQVKRQVFPNSIVYDVEDALNVKIEMHPKLIDSSEWTGRPTLSGQARSVMTLLPVARQNIESLIANPRHHNQPPEPIVENDLTAIKQLYESLGQLVALAEAGKPFYSLLTSVNKMTDQVFTFKDDTKEIFVSGLKATVAAQPVALCAWALIKAACIPMIASTAGPAAYVAMVAAHFTFKPRAKDGADPQAT